MRSHRGTNAVRPRFASRERAGNNRKAGRREARSGGSRASRHDPHTATSGSTPLASARFQGKYFWFWSSKNKNAFSLPRRSSRLPAFLLIRSPRKARPADVTEAQRQQPDALVRLGLGPQREFLLQAICGAAAIEVEVASGVRGQLRASRFRTAEQFRVARRETLRARWFRRRHDGCVDGIAPRLVREKPQRPARER